MRKKSGRIKNEFSQMFGETSRNKLLLFSKNESVHFLPEKKVIKICLKDAFLVA